MLRWRDAWAPAVAHILSGESNTARTNITQGALPVIFDCSVREFAYTSLFSALLAQPAPRLTDSGGGVLAGVVSLLLTGRKFALVDSLEDALDRYALPRDSLRDALRHPNRVLRDTAAELLFSSHARSTACPSQWELDEARLFLQDTVAEKHIDGLHKWQTLLGKFLHRIDQSTRKAIATCVRKTKTIFWAGPTHFRKSLLIRARFVKLVPMQEYGVKLTI